MKREPLIDVPPWALPLLVVAVTIPIVVAFSTGGPFLGQGTKPSAPER